MYKLLANFCALLFFLHLSCRPVPKKVRNVIENSSKNRKELEKVISHYKNLGNPEKLSSAYFLIQNLPSHSHYKGTGVENYKNAFSELINTPEDRKEELNTIWDSLKAGYGKKFPGLYYPVDDVDVLDSAYLVKHIDAAFEAWSYPWAKHLKFEAFCEYILPYKLVSEEPNQWIKNIQHKYRWL